MARWLNHREENPDLLKDREYRPVEVHIVDARLRQLRKAFLDHVRIKHEISLDSPVSEAILKVS